MESIRVKHICEVKGLPKLMTQFSECSNIQRAYTAPNASMSWIQCPSLMRGRVTVVSVDEIVTLYLFFVSITNDGQMLFGDDMNKDFANLLKATCRAWVKYQSRLTITLWSGDKTANVSVDDFFDKEFEIRDGKINVFNPPVSIYQLTAGIEFSGVGHTEGNDGVYNLMKNLESEPINVTLK